MDQLSEKESFQMAFEIIGSQQSLKSRVTQFQTAVGAK